MKKGNLDKLYRAFGNLVRLGRKHRALSQAKLGRLVGLSRTSIVNIEKGRHHLVIHQLLAFARALEVRPELLLPTEWHRGARKKLAKVGVAKIPRLKPTLGTLRIKRVRTHRSK
jgi:DNA-binding XRE family transcriptional regulator